MSRGAARLLVFAVALVLALALRARGAFAQVEPTVTARASAQEVEVGEPFTIELKALAEGGGAAVTDPQLHAPPEFSVQGPQISTQSIAQFGPGGSSVKTGIGATWQLVASKQGHYVISAPSVAWNGKRLRANAVTIDVVASTGRAHRPRPSPFLLPGGPSPSWPFGGRSPADELDDSEVDGVKELALDSAPDSQLFLRILADKTSAVVGEQVTLSFYVYHRLEFEMTDKRDAKLGDFVRVPLLKNPGTDPAQYAVAGGKRYAVRLLDKVAVFPLHAGELHTGAVSARFIGRAIRGSVVRESNDVVIHVTEPTRAGRPPGYVLGDVGKFSLSAKVEPRKIEQGGTIAVTLKVTGAGNMPQALRVPARTAAEWFDPEKRESIEAPGGTVGGWRSFGYVVRLTQSGSVDLGRVELPYWDPAANQYEVATAELGVVEVTPVAGAAPPAASAEPAEGERDAFHALPAVRRTLGAYTAPRPPLFDGGLFWWLLAAPPLLVGASAVAVRAARFARVRKASTQTSPAALSTRALREAGEAEQRGDARALSAAVERALYAAIEAATGLRGRGVLLGDLAGELTRRGVSNELAERVANALRFCEKSRFVPDADDLTPQPPLPVGRGGEVAAAKDLCRELLRTRAPTPAERGAA